MDTPAYMIYKWQANGKGGGVKFQVADNHADNTRSRETLLASEG